jgi:L-alanine-DL-glutamate epimerase-like enolase superfamily enzyme
MTNGYITALHPEEVAREVERLVKLGCRSFMLRPVAGGSMLDQERLGAARYAAGLHAVVELESLAPAAAR